MKTKVISVAGNVMFLLLCGCAHSFGRGPVAVVAASRVNDAGDAASTPPAAAIVENSPPGFGLVRADVEAARAIARSFGDAPMERCATAILALLDSQPALTPVRGVLSGVAAARIGRKAITGQLTQGVHSACAEIVVGGGPGAA